MAKRLEKTGVQTGQIIFASEVSQSIDAFTGVDAYDINLSGSLNVTGSTKIVGDTSITGSLNTLGAVEIENGFLKISSPNDNPEELGIQLFHPSTDEETGLSIEFNTKGDDNTAHIKSLSNDSLKIGTAGRDRLFITSSINGSLVSNTCLGVGVPNPKSMLHVSGSTIVGHNMDIKNITTIGDSGSATLSPQTMLNIFSSASNSDIVRIHNSNGSGAGSGTGSGPESILEITEDAVGNSVIDMRDNGGNVKNRFRAGSGWSHFSDGLSIGTITDPSPDNLYVSGSTLISKALTIDKEAISLGEQSLTVSGSAVLALPSGSKGFQDFQIMGAHTVEWDVTQEVTYFDDDYIILKSDLNSLYCEIRQNPNGSLVNVVYNNEGTYSYFDKQVSDGQFTLDSNFLDDETGIITIKAPKDSIYPFYRITVVRANISSYANNRIYAIIEKLFKPQLP